MALWEGEEAWRVEEAGSSDVRDVRTVARRYANIKATGVRLSPVGLRDFTWGCVGGRPNRRFVVKSTFFVDKKYRCMVTLILIVDNR